MHNKLENYNVVVIEKGKRLYERERENEAVLPMVCLALVLLAIIKIYSVIMKINLYSNISQKKKLTNITRILKTLFTISDHQRVILPYLNLSISIPYQLN